MDEEGLNATANKKIFIGNQIPIDSEQFTENLTKLKKYALNNNAEKTLEMLSVIVPTFHHKTNGANEDILE